MTLINEFENIAKKEETAWIPRSKATWLKEVDKNTSFFHKTTHIHSRANTTGRLKVGEVMIENQ